MIRVRGVTHQASKNTVLDGILETLGDTVLDGVLDLCLPYEVGEVARASAFPMQETEGSPRTNIDPSGISPVLADATSLDKEGKSRGVSDCGSCH